MVFIFCNLKRLILLKKYTAIYIIFKLLNTLFILFNGLLAFGTVAMLNRNKHQDISIKINGEKYNLKVIREGKHLRTFYPMIINN